MTGSTRVHYLRKMAWNTKSNKFRKLRTPGKQSTISRLKIIKSHSDLNLIFRWKTHYSIHSQKGQWSTRGTDWTTTRFSRWYSTAQTKGFQKANPQTKNRKQSLRRCIKSQNCQRQNRKSFPYRRGKTHEEDDEQKEGKGH